MKLQFKGTRGEWSVPHLSDEQVECNCPWVLCDSYCGSVATIDYSKEGADWREGDNPPISEAKLNGYLISAAPDLLQAAIDFMEFYHFDGQEGEVIYSKFKLAVNKALNIKE